MKYVACLALLFQACSPGQRDQAGTKSKGYEVRTFVVGKGWGYSIFINKKEYVRQLFIPCIEGRIPFKTPALARRTGLYVAHKMEHHSSPSLTKNDLMDLHIIGAQHLP